MNDDKKQHAPTYEEWRAEREAYLAMLDDEWQRTSEERRRQIAAEVEEEMGPRQSDVTCPDCNGRLLVDFADSYTCAPCGTWWASREVVEEDRAGAFAAGAQDDGGN